MKETTERQEVQPQDGRFDTGADTAKALNFDEPECLLMLLNAMIISDYFNMV